MEEPRRTKLISWLVLVIYITCFFIPRCADADMAAQENVTNADQAIARAAKFFEDVGWKLEAKPRGEPKARLLAPEGKPGRWEVRAGLLDVEVASQTGKILYAFRREEIGKRTQDIVKITETLANQRAAEYLKAAGISLDDKKLESSALAESGSMMWKIRYRRMYKGFPFHEDGLVIHLDPLDGSLIGFGDICGSSLPDTTDVKIEKDLAVQAARDYLAEFGLTAGNLTSADLKIVQPDDMWEYWEVGGYPSEATSSRLAWDVRFDAPWEGTAVFVDAENGSTLGGGMTRTFPKSKVNMPALTEIDTVIVGLADKWSEAVRLPGKGGDGQALIESIHSLRGAGMPRCKLSVTLKFEGKRRSYTFGYSPTAHRLAVLEKKYKDKTIKGELHRETSEEFEGLVARCVGRICMSPTHAKAVPKQPGKVFTPSDASPGVPRSPEYERLLSKYLAKIGKIVGARQKRLAGFNKDARKRARKVDRELSLSESQSLEKLRAAARSSPHKKLRFVGNSLEGKMLVASSAASARIFATLLKGGIADRPEYVMHNLAHDAANLSSAWVPLLQDIIKRRDPTCWQQAVQILYRAGVSRSKYRPLLEQWATKGDVESLLVLFFDIGRDTGIPKKVQTPQNISLVKKLAGPKSPPEIRAACANFAAEIGDRARAEAICTELLWQPYKGHGDGINVDPDPDDRPLGRAKINALTVLFYKVRTESAFKQVYDRANQAWTECDHPETLPEGWKCYSRYVVAQLEIDAAQGLIGEIECYDD